MKEDIKKSVLEEIEQKYFMIKRGALFYFLGGLFATALAIIGFSYASARSAIITQTEKLAVGELEEIRREADADANEIKRLLAETPDIESRVLNLENKEKSSVKSLSNLESAMPPIGSAVAMILSKEALNKLLETGVWLLSDGQVVDQNEYPELYESMHQNPLVSVKSLPDMRGKFLRGVDGDNDNDPDRDHTNPYTTVGSSQNHSYRFALKDYQRKSVYLQETDTITGIPIDKSTGIEDPRPVNIAVYWLIRAK